MAAAEVNDGPDTGDVDPAQQEDDVRAEGDTDVDVTLVLNTIPVRGRGKVRSRASARRLRGKRLHDAQPKPKTLRRRASSKTLEDDVMSSTSNNQRNNDVCDVTDYHDHAERRSYNPPLLHRGDVCDDLPSPASDDQPSRPRRRDDGWYDSTRWQDEAARGTDSEPDLRYVSPAVYTGALFASAYDYQRKNDFTGNVLKNLSKQHNVQELSAQPSVESPQRVTQRSTRQTTPTSRAMCAVDGLRSLARNLQDLFEPQPVPADARQIDETTRKLAHLTRKSKRRTNKTNNSKADTMPVQRETRFSEDDVTQRPSSVQTRVSIPTFDGSNYPFFKQLFDKCADQRSWDDDTRLMALYDSLRGDAKQLLALAADQEVTYTILCNILDYRFGTNSPYTFVMETLSGMRREHYTNIYEFAVDVKRAARRTQLSVDNIERLQYQTFVAGLADPDQRMYVEQNNPTGMNIMTALNLAVRYEDQRDAVQRMALPTRKQPSVQATSKDYNHQVNFDLKQYLHDKERLWRQRVQCLENRNAWFQRRVATLRRHLNSIQERQERLTNRRSDHGSNPVSPMYRNRYGCAGRSGFVRFSPRARVRSISRRRQPTRRQTVSQSAFVPPGQPPRCNLWNLRVRQPDVFGPRACNM